MTSTPQNQGIELLSTNKTFNGNLFKFRHQSRECACPMQFNVYQPPIKASTLPVVIFLSGLTCTEDNFAQKAGAFRAASELGLCIVMPDTSPRGCKLPGEDDAWDFGTGAGFYVDASQEPWAKYYRMASYVTEELLQVLKQVPLHGDVQLDLNRVSIMGHSMGGHGALVLGLRNPELFQSISAFSPIAHPAKCPWGDKCFGGYLGKDDRDSWKQWDATELSQGYNQKKMDILIDTGLADDFLKEQLLVQDFVDATKNHPLLAVQSRMHDGYDHSYFFISTFIDDHLRFHAKHLNP